MGFYTVDACMLIHFSGFVSLSVEIFDGILFFCWFRFLSHAHKLGLFKKHRFLRYSVKVWNVSLTHQKHFRQLILKHYQGRLGLQLDLFMIVGEETVFHPLSSNFFHFHSINFWRNVASCYFSKHWDSTTIQDTSNYRSNVEHRFAQAY